MGFPFSSATRPEQIEEKVNITQNKTRKTLKMRKRTTKMIHR